MDNIRFVTINNLSSTDPTKYTIANAILSSAMENIADNVYVIESITLYAFTFSTFLDGSLKQINSKTTDITGVLYSPNTHTDSIIFINDAEINVPFTLNNDFSMVVYVALPNFAKIDEPTSMAILAPVAYSSNRVSMTIKLRLI